MAEKEKKSEGGGLSKLDDTELAVTAIFVLLLVAALISRLQEIISGKWQAGNKIIAVILPYLSAFLPLAKILSLGLSSLCLVGIFYLFTKISKIRSEERLIYYPPLKTIAENVKNRKWERITDHINSQNQNDWKLAILEADIILDDMLDSMGYRGATMSEKLEGVERSDFTTIDSAWEAHKIRNSIAHEGIEFLLTEREARRIIGLYESVFKEFNYI